MDKDEMLTFMVENGLLSAPWHFPLAHKAPVKKTASSKKQVDKRIVAYHRGGMSESKLCNSLGIKESELFRYLVDHGVLFYFE